MPRISTLSAPPPTAVTTGVAPVNAIGVAKINVSIVARDPMRTYFPREGLIHLAEYQVPTTRELEDFEVKRTSVWAFP